MKQTVCSVGDIIFIDKMPENYDIAPLKNIIEKADVKLFNLENVLSDKPIYGSSYCGGVWLLAKEDTLDDTLKFGFNGCSFSNNHTMDYSYEGMFSTLNAAKKRNLPICGAGKDLPEAADYAVIETENGKCGIISLCSSINDAARAGNPSGTLPGRPGLNPLRFSTVYHVTPEQMKTLKEISASTHIDGRRNRSRAGGYTPYAPEGCFGFGDYVFCESDIPGKTSKVNPVDMERTEETIKRALGECETVIVNIHSHEIKHDTDDEPDDFMIEFCHKCIDAGASAVIGTGTHQLKGLEVYRGKLIFYSIGNYIFHSDSAFCMPDDYRERYRMPKELTPREMINIRNQNNTRGLHSDVNKFRSLLPFMTFEDGELTGAVLYPIRLDMATGFPSLADEEETKIIYEYLCDRNKQFSTVININDKVIEVKLK
jgi:poly-gamma-glutamate synthesis protein (capsule biosynthesis protein)